MTRALLIGANGGIGSAIAAALAIAGRDENRLRSLARTLGPEVSPRPVDITDESSVKALVEVAAADHGLDVAVNNAGVSHRPGPLHTLSAETVEEVFATVALGTFRAMRHELAACNDGARLVNIASSAGVAGAPGMGAYVAAKHAVIGMTRTAALDYADRGIRANAVAPGPIDSGGISQQPEEMRERIAAAVPLARLGTPDEVAATVTWLAGPHSSYLTGTVLQPDGGKAAGNV